MASTSAPRSPYWRVRVGGTYAAAAGIEDAASWAAAAVRAGAACAAAPGNATAAVMASALAPAASQPIAARLRVFFIRLTKSLLCSSDIRETPDPTRWLQAGR